MKSNRLITEEYMDHEPTFNNTATITYKLPTKRNMVTDPALKKSLGW